MRQREKYFGSDELKIESHLLESSFLKKNLKKIDKKARRTKVFCITFLDLIHCKFLSSCKLHKKRGRLQYKRYQNLILIALHVVLKFIINYETLTTPYFGLEAKYQKQISYKYIEENVRTQNMILYCLAFSIQNSTSTRSLKYNYVDKTF